MKLMGLLSKIKEWVTEAAGTFREFNLPLNKCVQTLEELERAIEMHKAELQDPFFHNNREYCAYAQFALALCYHRKATFYTRYQRDDVSAAIHFAHQAESFFTEETAPGIWVRVQGILGFGYALKADGPRAENAELVASYLERFLRAPEVLSDPAFAASVHIYLMLAYGGCLSGTMKERLAKVEEHAAKAFELYPHRQDSAWFDHLEYYKASSLMAVRSMFGVPDDEELNFKLETFGPPSERKFADMEDGVDMIPLISTSKRMQNIFHSVLEGVTDLPDWESYETAFRRDLDNQRPTVLANYPALFPPERLQAFAASVEELIRECVAYTESFAAPFSRAVNEMQLAHLYMNKAFYAPGTGAAEESIERARDYFEKAWAYLLQHPRNRHSLVSDGRIFGTSLYFLRGMWQEADRVYSAALDELAESYAASAGTRGKDLALLELSEGMVALSLNQAYVLAKRGRPEQAVGLLEKWRARRLGERLRRTDPQLARARDEDLAAYEQALNEIHALEAAQRDAGHDEYLELSNKLRATRANLENVTARVGSYPPDASSPPAFGEARPAAKADAPFAYLLTTEVGALILLVTMDGNVRCLWCDEFTKGDAEALLRKLSGAVGQTGGRVGAAHVLPFALMELGYRLMTPLRQTLSEMGAESVCLIPCGVLALFPLQAATVEYGETFCDTIEVSYAPSANALFNARRKLERFKAEPHARAPKFVAVADPDGSLRHAAPEVKAIARLFEPPASTTLLLRDEATRTALENALPDATHIHFACHGGFDPAEPLEAALMLADGQRLMLREVLDASAFRHLPFARTVVLSACRTALIDYKERPEEMVGLPAGFLAAGVPGVLGTLWPVDDLSTALLMTHFYVEFFERGRAPARALREAQKWLSRATREDLEEFCAGRHGLENSLRSRDAHYVHQKALPARDRPFAHPWYWSGFVFIGV